MTAEKTELQTLLETHDAEIKKLEAKLKDILLPETDQVWLLRYILSYKSADAAEEACKFSINWLKENADQITALKAGEKPHLADVITRYQVVGEHKYNSKGEPIFIVRIGLCNTKGLMDAVPYNDVVEFMTIARMKTLDYCDRKTREEGRIIRAITILDFQGFSVARGNDSRFTRVLGETSKLSEKLFPQLLGLSIFVNVPRFMYWAINVVKPLMSKRAVEKMRICPGFTSGKTIADCPYLSQYLTSEDLPTFLGGKCDCPGGCIGGVPNSQTFAINDIDADGLMSVTVSSRHTQHLDFPLTKGAKVHYQLKVKDRKIEILSTLKEIGGTEHPIIAKKYLNAEDGVLSGDYVAPVDGTLTFIFDNTHSMMRSKNVMYKVEIL
jgi:hypothetical protein